MNVAAIKLTIGVYSREFGLSAARAGRGREHIDGPCCLWLIYAPKWRELLAGPT